MRFSINSTIGADDDGTIRAWKIIDIVEESYVVMAVENMLDNCSSVPNGILELRTEKELKSFNKIQDTSFKTPSLIKTPKLKVGETYNDNRPSISTRYKILKKYDIGFGFYLVRFVAHDLEKWQNKIALDTFRMYEWLIG